MIGLRFFFSLKSADVRGAGTHDEPLRHLRGRLLDSVVIPTWDGMGSSCRKILRESL